MPDVMQKIMTPQEARTCIDEINGNLRNTRALLLDLYEREGWRALGYENWEKCVTSEFKEKRAYLFYQLAAAKAEKNIIAQSTTVDKIGTIPERHLRPLTSLAPEQQREVYEKAVETAPDGKVTAKHVEETVKEMSQKGHTHTETYLVTDALIFAGFAITQLERIRDDDPKMEDAFVKVETWIKNKRR